MGECRGTVTRMLWLCGSRLGTCLCGARGGGGGLGVAGWTVGGGGVCGTSGGGMAYAVEEGTTVGCRVEWVLSVYPVDCDIHYTTLTRLCTTSARRIGLPCWVATWRLMPCAAAVHTLRYPRFATGRSGTLPQTLTQQSSTALIRRSGPLAAAWPC